MDPILTYFSLSELLMQAEQLLNQPITEQTLVEIRRLRREVEHRRAEGVPV